MDKFSDWHWGGIMFLWLDPVICIIYNNVQKSSKNVSFVYISFWIILNQFESFWSVLKRLEAFWIVLNHFESFWIILNRFESFRIVLNLRTKEFENETTSSFHCMKSYEEKVAWLGASFIPIKKVCDAGLNTLATTVCHLHHKQLKCLKMPGDFGHENSKISG